MPFGTRTMSSNGSSGSSIQSQITQQIDFAKNFLQQNTPEVVKKDIDDRTSFLSKRYDPINVVISNVQTTPDEKIAALQSLKDNGIKYFILNFDTTKSNSEYAPPVAYIQALFNGFKPIYPTDELVVSYETPSPLAQDIAQQIDAEITKLQGASVQAQPAKRGWFGFGGRKQKRTKKGRKNSKRKTKKHKKKRTRRR
mgnify:CR=1 FL=1|jgi:hypothetical protein